TSQPTSAPATTATAARANGGIGACPFCTAGSSSAARWSQGVNAYQPTTPPANGNANCGSGGAIPLFRGRNNKAVNAGLNVNELNAEITVETAMVNANWRKNCPVMPAMKAHGTKTAPSTRPTAITGPATCCIALRVA